MLFSFFFFFFSFAYTTSPAAVMKLVVFFRSSKAPIISGETELLMATVRFALVGVCYISKEHAWLSGSPHRRDTLWKGRFLVSCACVRWACCGRNAVVPKPPGRACQEGAMHPSPFWVSALFWWWWSFPGNGCWLMVALLAIIILHAQINARNKTIVRTMGSVHYFQFRDTKTNTSWLASDQP